jgi:uncharacterized membrane protein YfcA
VRWTIAAIGLLTGALASVVGGGAEILLVPLLVWSGALPDHKLAVGTSLACLLLPIGAFAVVAYARARCAADAPCVHWPSALILAAAFTAGSLASFWTVRLPGRALRRAFGLVAIATGALMLLAGHSSRYA